MFDFSPEKKDKYYARGEQYLEDNAITYLHIDKTQFGVNGRTHEVRLYLIPFYRKTVTKAQLQHAKGLENIVITNDRFSRHKQGMPNPLRENGYIRLPLDEEDR